MSIIIEAESRAAGCAWRLNPICELTIGAYARWLLMELVGSRFFAFAAVSSLQERRFCRVARSRALPDL